MGGLLQSLHLDKYICWQIDKISKLNFKKISFHGGRADGVKATLEKVYILNFFLPFPYYIAKQLQLNYNSQS